MNIAPENEFLNLGLASRRQRPCQEDGDHLKKTALFKKTATMSRRRLYSRRRRQLTSPVSEYKPTCV